MYLPAIKILYPLCFPIGCGGRFLKRLRSSGLFNLFGMSDLSKVKGMLKSNLFVLVRFSYEGIYGSITCVAIFFQFRISG